MSRDCCHVYSLVGGSFFEFPCVFHYLHSSVKLVCRSPVTKLMHPTYREDQCGNDVGSLQHRCDVFQRFPVALFRSKQKLIPMFPPPSRGYAEFIRVLNMCTSQRAAREGPLWSRKHTSSFGWICTANKCFKR